MNLSNEAALPAELAVAGGLVVEVARRGRPPNNAGNNDMGRIKSLDEIKAMVRERTGKRNVFRRARIEDVDPVLERLTSKDPDLWAAEWSRAAEPYESAGNSHDRAGRPEEAREAFLMAYTCYTIGRYPVPHSPGKQECARKSLELFMRAGRYFTPPLEVLEIPFRAGGVIRAFLRMPEGAGPSPVVINFGGIDSYKPECHEYDEELLRAGLGVCAMDMPGVGEAPIKGLDHRREPLQRGHRLSLRTRGRRCTSHRHFGQELRRLLVREDELRGTRTAARRGGLGRRGPLQLPAGLGAPLHQCRKLPHGSRDLPRQRLRPAQPR